MWGDQPCRSASPCRSSLPTRSSAYWIIAATPESTSTRQSKGSTNTIRRAHTDTAGSAAKVDTYLHNNILKGKGKMKAYKGFNKDMTCRGFQYEIGKTYETDEADLCNSGFHACENPLDCFKYYSPAKSKYCAVEIEDNGQRHTDDSKVVGKKIKIGAELSVAQICKIHFDYVKERCIPAKSTAAGDRESASAGEYGSASAGEYGSASAGNGGSAAAGNGGSASAGDGGSASAGDGGSASAGEYGSASAGKYGSASAG